MPQTREHILLARQVGVPYIVVYLNNVGADGMVMDFADIGRVVEEKVISILDHSYLNDLLGDKSSLERLAEWVWQALDEAIPLRRIGMWETDNNFLIYNGPRREN